MLGTATEQRNSSPSDCRRFSTDTEMPREEEMPCAYPKAFIDTGFATLHHVTKYWGAGLLKVFRGVVDETR